MYIIKPSSEELQLNRKSASTVFGNSFLAFDFVGSAWSFGFFIPPQRSMTSDFEGFSIPDFIHYIYFPILILEKEPVFPLLNVQC